MSESTEAIPMAFLDIHKGPESELVIGGLRLVACRREVGDIDGGITLCAFAAPSSSTGTDSSQAGASSPEFFRFDLFRARPHYHAPAEKQEECVIEVEAGGERAWGVDAVTRRWAELLDEGGYTAFKETLNGDELGRAALAIESLFDQLEEPNETSRFEVPQSVLDGLAAG